MIFPFAGIVSKEDIPEGPEAEEWLKVAPTQIFLSQLYLTQNQVFAMQLFNENSFSPVWVGCWQGFYYVYNGHHRVVKAALRGDLTINARVCII